ncbi:MAG: transposase [Bacteroidales bacterium]|nr:transposase [Bacteroidales bacterium]
MKKGTRRKFTPEYKAKVAIEAIKEKETLAELSRRFNVHANIIGKWKQEFLNNSSNAFTTGNKKNAKEDEIEKVYAKIGQLEMENDFFLKKSLDRLD